MSRLANQRSTVQPKAFGDLPEASEEQLVAMKLSDAWGPVALQEVIGFGFWMVLGFEKLTESPRDPVPWFFVPFL